MRTKLRIRDFIFFSKGAPRDAVLCIERVPDTMNLPTEIWTEILSLFSGVELAPLCLVCRRWREHVVKNQTVWIALYTRDFGGPHPKQNVRHPLGVGHFIVSGSAVSSQSGGACF